VQTLAWFVNKVITIATHEKKPKRMRVRMGNPLLFGIFGTGTTPL
jgi:hypothetical protein